MGQPRLKKTPLETQLGLLAMQFRETRDEKKRAEVAAAYKRVLAHLMESKKWKEMPSFEDMLPDDHMPQAFYDFWSIPSPHHQDTRGRRAT